MVITHHMLQCIGIEMHQKGIDVLGKIDTREVIQERNIRKHCDNCDDCNCDSFKDSCQVSESLEECDS